MIMITKKQIEEVKTTVIGLWKISSDDEAAHVVEDKMLLAVLEIIEQRSTDSRAREIAAEALKSKNIKFARYCS
jgi:hypothetical protein